MMRPRKVLRIARWEVTKGTGGIDRRTVAVVLVIAVFAGVAAPLAANQGLSLDEGLYRIDVAEDSPYYAPAAADPTFAIRDGPPVELEAGAASVTFARTEKGGAAMAAFRSSVGRYNDRLMSAEANQSAAFPVVVDVRYVERESIALRPGGGTDSPAESETPTPDQGTATPDDSDPSGGDGTPSDGQVTLSGGDRGTAAGEDQGGLLGLGGGPAANTPSAIAPPFPFQSLVLAFVFVLPLNFVIQVYGSSILSERINRRGELMLVSPVSPGEIIAGKTLPYFAGSLAVVAGISLVLGGGALAVAAVAPLVLLFLGSTFVGAMFARSFKELTFVTVTVTVTLTSYAFVPAIFTDVNAIALISPLTLVVRDLQGAAVGLGEAVFSVTPPLLTGIVLFGLGSGLYREEDMFTQRRIPLKALDMLAARIHRKRSLVLLTALLLPFVLVAELLAVAGLFAVPIQVSIPLVLVVVAVIEEVAKSVGVYAGYVHGRFEAGVLTALTVGALSGLGFFLGEKLALIAQLVGLPDLAAGEAALATGVGPSGLPVLLALLIAPLALHVVTAGISAVGASRGKWPWVAAMGVAMVVHVAYNYSVVVVLG